MAKHNGDARGLLAASHTSRDAARNHLDEATTSLTKAEAFLTSVQVERERAQFALSKAETDQAGTIAKSIRDGKQPDVGLTPTIRSAQAALAEIESRHRMAKQAHDQLADERTKAETELREAEAAVTAAAERVIVSETEQQYTPDKINAAIAFLTEADEQLFGLGRLWIGGKVLNPSQALQVAFTRLEPLRVALAGLRPGRPVLAPPVEHDVMQRLMAYRDALVKNPTVVLADVPTPVFTPPKLPSTNIIERDREALLTRIGNAA